MIKKVKSNIKYLYLLIKKSPNNKNKYKGIKISFSIISNNKYYIKTPINEYQQYSIIKGQNQSNYHMLKKGFINDNYIMIEFSSNYNDIQLLILDDIDQTHNTSRIINSYLELGRKVIYLNTNKTNYFILKVLGNKNKEINYFFKYSSYESSIPNCTSKFNNTSTIKYNDNILLRFFPIICHKGQNRLPYNITYYIRLLNTKNDSLHYYIFPEKNINEKSGLLFISNQDEFCFNHSIKSYGEIELYHISIIAFIAPLKQFLIYKPFNNELKSNLTIIVSMIGICIIIITLIISIIYILGKEKNKIKKKVENISNIHLDLDSQDSLSENLISEK